MANENARKSFRKKHASRRLKKPKKLIQIFRPIRRFWDLATRLEHRRIKEKKK